MGNILLHLYAPVGRLQVGQLGLLQRTGGTIEVR